MTPVVTSTVNNVPLIPGISFITRKHDNLKKFNIVRCSTKQALSPQKYTSIRLFPHLGTKFALHRQPRATGTDTALEEAVSPVSNEDPPPASAKSSATSAPRASSAQTKRSKPTRKSEMPPVKPEELVPGATFTGKVRSIQPFGAFVDFGAFTDGLVHVSQLSDGYVKDVGSVVSVGQEVSVRLVEANVETSRISLTMRISEDGTNQKGPAETSRPARKGPPRSNQKREDTKNASKFVKGQDLEGTVKNLTRSGAFISLPEGEEGFLPQDEEIDEGFANMMGGSTSLQVGQEVSVRVLRFSRGKVTLTMKKEEAGAELDSKLSSGVMHKATNPFLLAFRKNEDIASFLDEREKEEGKPDESVVGEDTSVEEKVEISSEVAVIEENEPIVTENVATEEVPKTQVDGEDTSVDEKAEISSEVAVIEENEPIVTENVATEEVPETQVDGEDTSVEEKVEISSEVAVIEENEPIVTENVATEEVPETQVDGEDTSVEEKVEISSEVAVIEENEPIVTENVATEEVPETQVDGEDTSIEEKVEISSEVAVIEVNKPIVTENVATEEVPETQVDDEVVKDEIEDLEVPVPQSSVVEDVSSPTIPKDEKVEASLEDNGTVEENEVAKEVENVIVEVAESQQDDVIAKDENEESNTEDTNEEIEVSKDIENEINGTESKGEIETETSDTAAEVLLAILVEEKVDSSPEETTTETEESKEIENVTETPTPIEDTVVEPVPEVKNSVNVSSEESNETSTNESTTKATISPALVKKLRDETGAGMMDCKNALSETEGDLVKAQELLRKKGLSSADKKASRATAEGRIGSYIHDSRIGVLIEVNCETDFVSRGDIFKELVDDLAMQVAACPQVQYFVTDDVDKEVVAKERAIEMQKEDLLSKPEQIREKIVDGRIRKRLEELALLEQPYIKNDKMVVKDWVKNTIATVGENIKVKRFVRFNLGEGLEKKSQDFAAEVAAQTAAKSAPPPVTDQPAAVVEEKPIVDEPKVAVSAALVKQLRDETGAGMMDCKKALSETGGDLEKAQEYLRKKGLSTADKKSSRIAAEGRIGEYIHDSRIGVLIEVNCETDFVGRSERFKELANDLAMQVVACPQVQYVSIEDIPAEVVRKEKEMEMQREDLLSKPESIREKIVEGRVSKRLGELALLEQPFIKDDSVLVKDLVKQTVAGLGENIKVRRFVRFTLGESNESSETKVE